MQHVREQNWFAVSLDVIVVIVGIFLGLQVQDWNEIRKDKDLEQQYLNRILEDQKATLASVQGAIDILDERSEDLIVVLEYLEGRQTQPPTESTVQNSLCYWYVPTSVEIQSSAFDELVSTGRLNLIQNEELRNTLQRTHNKHNAVSFDFNVLSQPSQVKARFLEPFIHWQAKSEEQIVIHRENVSGTSCKVDLEAIASSPEAVSIIAQLYRSQVIFKIIRQEQSDYIVQVIQQIEH